MSQETDNPAEIIEKLGSASMMRKRFLEQRRIFLWGPVTDDSAKELVQQMMYLDGESPGQPITFYINSPGGAVTSGFTIMDTMDMISSPVYTVCTGLAASMGSIILANGAKGHRYITRYGQVMIHQPSMGQMMGQATDLEIRARQILKTKELGARIIADACGQSYEKVMKDFDRDYWMDADESLEYGIVDQKVDKAM
jgi:ATP-dependent Clp protease protease subunit